MGLRCDCVPPMNQVAETHPSNIVNSFGEVFSITQYQNGPAGFKSQCATLSNLFSGCAAHCEGASTTSRATRSSIVGPMQLSISRPQYIMTIYG